MKAANRSAELAEAQGYSGSAPGATLGDVFRNKLKGLQKTDDGVGVTRQPLANQWRSDPHSTRFWCSDRSSHSASSSSTFSSPRSSKKVSRAGAPASGRNIGVVELTGTISDSKDVIGQLHELRKDDSHQGDRVAHRLARRRGRAVARDLSRHPARQEGQEGRLLDGHRRRVGRLLRGRRRATRSTRRRAPSPDRSASSASSRTCRASWRWRASTSTPSSRAR